MSQEEVRDSCRSPAPSVPSGHRQHLFLTGVKHTSATTQTWWVKPRCVLSCAWEGVNSLQKPLCLLKCLLYISVLVRWPHGSSAVSSRWSQPQPKRFTLSARGIVIQPPGSLPLSPYGTQSACADSVCQLPLVALEYWANCQLQTHLLKTWANHSPQSDVQSWICRARSFPCYNVQG